MDMLHGHLLLAFAAMTIEGVEGAAYLLRTRDRSSIRLFAATALTSGSVFSNGNQMELKEPTSVPELNLADALQRGIGLRLERRFAGLDGPFAGLMEKDHEYFEPRSRHGTPRVQCHWACNFDPLEWGDRRPKLTP